MQKCNTPLSFTENIQLNECKEKKPRLSLGFILSSVKSDSSCYLTGTDATCASVNSARSAVNYSLNSLYIGLPCSVGSSVRVRNFDTEFNFFTAKIAFSHWSAPPLIYVQIFI